MRAQLRSAAAETVGCLAVALFVNVAILVTSAAAFHSRGLTDVATLEDAHALLGTVLKDGRAASVLFALALLASGQSSTITGTLAGQVVMEGFVDVRVRPALRRVVTRVVTIAPAAIAASLAGDAGLNQLLILSQVVLSFCLPFALVPLMVVVADAKVMGAHAARGVARAAGWVITAVIVALNVRSLWAQLA